ncbi:MAG: hypothetical protein ACRDCC_06305 [Culicoidibacterales bacterium]
MKTYYSLLEKRDIYRTVLCTQSQDELIMMIKDNVQSEYLTNFTFELEQAINNATTEDSSEFGIMSNNFIVLIEKFEE